MSKNVYSLRGGKDAKGTKEYLAARLLPQGVNV